jgi:proteasome accessory factor B
MGWAQPNGSVKISGQKTVRGKGNLPRARPPLERMLRIHQALQSAQYPNASGLAVELEVSTKSVHRDLEFMRDRLGLPVEYDGSRRGYAYTEEVSGFPTLQITEGELFALLVAERALQQYRGTNFERPLASAFRKLAASLPDTVSINLADWEGTISFRTSAEPILDLGRFDQLSKATAQRRQVRLEYRKAGQRAVETRVVDPYHLANINGEWFLFAYCHLRRDIRTFVPARIQKVELTGKRFVPSRRFSLAQRLRDSFGVITGAGEYEVVVRFAEAVADYLREKRWHPSQTLRELPDGQVELRFRLSSLTEVQRWILSWGGRARVLSPPELVASIRHEAEQLLEVDRVSRESRASGA